VVIKSKAVSKESNEKDRISGRTIILNADGRFPKKILIIEHEKQREYSLVKTRNGKYMLH